jgi:hypothetical protein
VKNNNSRTSSAILCREQDKSVVGGSISKKRDEKVAEKQLEQMEKESFRSGSSDNSKISRSTSGRFEAKYKVGEKTANGVRVREVIEIDWEEVNRDKKGNTYYKCLKCFTASKVRKDDRKKHSCKQKWFIC